MNREINGKIKKAVEQFIEQTEDAELKFHMRMTLKNEMGALRGELDGRHGAVALLERAHEALQMERPRVEAATQRIEMALESIHRGLKIIESNQ